MLGEATTNADLEATGSVKSLQWFTFALFFVFGGITSLNDVIIPKLKELFTLTHASSMLVQTAFFLAYALFSLPAAIIVDRLGYLPTATIGLLTMTAGCLLFIPASANAAFGLFLVALFVLGAGITIVQVVANPLISLLGDKQTAPSRLTFAQAFNSLGTTIFPRVGSVIILGGLAGVTASQLHGTALDAYRVEATRAIVHTYLALSVALVVIAIAVWSQRAKLRQAQVRSSGLFTPFTLLNRPRFSLGVLCIFLYVGAEVSIGSLIVTYLMQPSVWGVTDLQAGNHVFYYWGGAMVGRFFGAGLLRVLSPGKLLSAVAAGAIALILTSSNSVGAVSGWALLAIGLMNSIMFPTIFALASEGLGVRAAEGSGVIATAIVGGAVVPWFTGLLADTITLKFALVLPALCYGIIAMYGLYARKQVAPAPA